MAPMVLFACNFGLYLFPIFYGFFILSSYYTTMTQWDTPYSFWVYIEIKIFVSWILASTLFLLLAYLFKYRATWQEAAAFAHGNIWKLKDCDDFLNYIKFEYRAFCIALVFTIFHILTIISYLEGSLNHPEERIIRLILLILNPFN